MEAQKGTRHETEHTAIKNLFASPSQKYCKLLRVLYACHCEDGHFWDISEGWVSYWGEVSQKMEMLSFEGLNPE